MEEIEEILMGNDEKQLKELFAFDSTNSDDEILVKFNLFARRFHARYFTSDDADIHREIDLYNLHVYRGKLISFVNIAFRGAAKTARTKLFRAFVICCDLEHSRKYLKIATEDIDNAVQIVTDVYNMLIAPAVKRIYPEVFAKTTTKREERMDSFTTATGIKLIAVTVGTNQRGKLQDESRPDEIWFEDFESRTTLRSRRKTKSIWDNMEEARTGLAKGGGCIYTCNYISEQGNVHKIVTEKLSDRKKILIAPIIDEIVYTTKEDNKKHITGGKIIWDRYTLEEIDQMYQDDDDFEGERLCKPSASKDVYFDRETLDLQKKKDVLRASANFKIYKEFDPSHRYGSGHDISGGVGLDHSTSVFIDFDTYPAQVVGTFISNTIKPEAMGSEIYREAQIFGGCINAIEKNYGDSALLKAKQLGCNLYKTQKKGDKIDDTGQSTEYGWHTNSVTKDQMLSQFSKAVEDGVISLNDKDLIAECKSYTRNDLLETVRDPRLVTNHFDLLMAACIAWQTKSFAEVIEKKEEYVEELEDVNYPSIWGGQ